MAAPTAVATESDDLEDPNYPVFFNIFLWFGIAYVMVLLATSREYNFCTFNIYSLF